jgi:hypothetical protein
MIIEKGSTRLIVNELPEAIAIYVGKGGGHCVLLEVDEAVALAKELARIAGDMLAQAEQAAPAPITFPRSAA